MKPFSEFSLHLKILVWSSHQYKIAKLQWEHRKCRLQLWMEMFLSQFVYLEQIFNVDLGEDYWLVKLKELFGFFQIFIFLYKVKRALFYHGMPSEEQLRVMGLKMTVKLSNALSNWRRMIHNKKFEIVEVSLNFQKRSYLDGQKK